MYRYTLNKTSIEILSFLNSKIRQTFTVKQIAEGIKKDYKITYTMTMRLAKQQYIIAEKKPPVTNCRLNLKGNTSLLAYIEAIRADRFFEKHKDIQLITQDLTSKITNPYYSLLIFGSYPKEAASEKSDIDLLIIIPERILENKIDAAVGSTQHISPITIHHTILTSIEFTGLLKAKKPNVAWEAIDNRVVPYGAESFLRLLEEYL